MATYIVSFIWICLFIPTLFLHTVIPTLPYFYKILFLFTLNIYVDIYVYIYIKLKVVSINLKIVNLQDSGLKNAWTKKKDNAIRINSRNPKQLDSITLDRYQMCGGVTPKQRSCSDK